MNKKDKSKFSSSLTDFDLRLDDYSVEQYMIDIDNYGLDAVWNVILNSLTNESDAYGIINIRNLGELYEIGLARVNKVDKKEHGKYYTPDDVANLMSEWFLELRGMNVCDVCCGTGNLILSYLSVIGKERAQELISSGRLYLYDQDALALNICKKIIELIYGKDISANINCILGDFLDKKISLPNDCKVISNPPYFKIKNIKKSWKSTVIIEESKELYSAFMEKIIDESRSSVIITPYSFIGGNKFYSLRKKMNSYNGFIVSFDNVPGNIFTGRKHGIFNSNAVNSVRAAITVVENKKGVKGFRCSNLIRFKNSERKGLLKADVLKMFIGNEYQIVNENNKKYVKCHPLLENVLNNWKVVANGSNLSRITSSNGKFVLCVPNTCRYYSVASYRDLNRVGKSYLLFDDEEVCAYAYCLLNSSFCYWHWRLYDGGITYSVSLLKELPDVYNALSIEQKRRLLEIANEMKASEEYYLSYKKNAGYIQENIKFPDKYRIEINKIILESIRVEEKFDIFNTIHSNTALSINEEVAKND